MTGMWMNKDTSQIYKGERTIYTETGSLGSWIESTVKGLTKTRLKPNYILPSLYIL